MQNLYSFEILWSWGVLGVKVGILLFYWRVFPTRLFRTVVVLIGCFSVSIFLVNFFVFTFQCLPISRFWTPTGPGSCVKQDMYYLASAIINVIGDAIVLFAPLPAIWNLQTSRSKKWSLSFLFLLGTLHVPPPLFTLPRTQNDNRDGSKLTIVCIGSVCLASVFRIVAVTQIDPKDFTYSNVAGGLWSTVEVEVGFICANLPATRPLFVRCFGWGGSSSYASGGGSRSAYGVMSSGHRYGTGRRFGEEDKYGAVELTRHRNGSDESNLVSSPSHAKGTTNAITVTTDVEIVRVDSISQDERRRNLMDVVESHSPL